MPRRFRKLPVIGSLAALLLLATAVCCLAPAVWMFLGTFWHDSGFTLEAWRAAFANPLYIAKLLGNSLAVGLGTTAIALALGIPTGFLCFRTDLPGRKLLIVALVAGAGIPLYVVAGAWMAVCGSSFWLGLDSTTARLVGAAWLQGLGYLPLTTLLTGATFAMGHRDLEDLARLEAGPLKVIYRVSLPLARWGIVITAGVVFVLAVGDITVTDLLVVRTFPEATFLQFQHSSQPWQAAAVSWPLALVFALVLIWSWRALRRHGDRAVDDRPAPPYRLGLLFKAAGITWLLLTAAILLVPLVGLLRVVGDWQTFVTAIRATSDELRGSLSLTPVAATVATVLAFGWSWLWRRGSRACRWGVVSVVLILLSVPPPIIGIGLIHLFNRPGIAGAIYDSPAILIVAYVIRTVPFATLAILPVLRQIPNDALEAARLDGAGELRLALRFGLPLAWRGPVIAWFLAAILALGDLGASFLVVPPGATTLTVRFFTLIHYGLYGDAASICLVLLGGVLLPGAVLALLLRRALPGME